jgi:catechol 2,3-dioxygenase-like lactoylglutathione lyase family enzyme
MFARIKHIAIISDQYALQKVFYQEAFGMTGAAKKQSEALAVTVTDGYVGLNINPRKSGRAAGLDHFGLDCEDLNEVMARLKARYPAIEVLARPSTRPFASYTTHDPAGNLFDISQRGMVNRASVYAEESGGEPNVPTQLPAITHFALRTMQADAVALFYQDVFELKPLPKDDDDPNHYLSDGRVTLVLMPWSILDYAGTGIARPGPDHIGFRVENVEETKAHLQKLSDGNPDFRRMPVGAGAEGQARLKLFSCCRYGAHQLADVDGVLIDINDH